MLRGARPLATVVYSDRYFRYGLPLRARRPPPRRAIPAARPASAPHVLPLQKSAGSPAARAGLLLDATVRRPAAPRCAAEPPRRTLRSPPALAVAAEARFQSPEVGLEAARRVLPLDYRQARGSVPRRAAGRRSPAALPVPALVACPPADEGVRPAFALPEGAVPESEPAYETASRRSSAACASGPLERKVLNTERYNNGAAAARARLGRGRLQRGTVRAMLACSSLLYTLAFVAFYFLSLP